MEDQPQVLEAARLLLSQLGYQVLSATTPEQALDMARAHPHPIHLLLSDVGLPGMSGAELASRVVAERPGIKVLLMSGYARGSEQLLAAEKRWGRVIEKPLTLEVLARRIRQALAGSSST